MPEGAALADTGRRRPPGRRGDDLYPSRVGGAAGLLPRRDPVVHGAPERPGPLSREQVRAYQEQGFLALHGLFQPSEVETLQAELSRLRREPAGIDPETRVLEPDSRELRSIFRVHEQCPLLARLACDSRLVEIARFLLADDVYVHQSRLNYKPGFAGREFYWHSDFETWHVEDGMPRMRALSASLSLTKNTELNGPLMLVPGSHHTYVTCIGETPDDHYRHSLRRQEYGVPDRGSLETLVDRGGLAAPTGPAGTLVLFECNVMHGSNGNITPLPRSNAFFVYNALSNRPVEPFGGKPPRPPFIAAREGIAPLVAQKGRFA